MATNTLQQGGEDDREQQRRQSDIRRQTYDQAHRRVLREDPSYRSALVIRRAVLDALHAAAYVDAAAAGVHIVTVGQAAVEAAWGKLPPCDRSLCGDAGASADFVAIVGHHDDCPRGRAIRALRIHGV